MNTIQSYLSFEIGNEHFAANVSCVHNIIEYTKITFVPMMPAYMLGVINLRGRVLPVMDARLKFGISDTTITTRTCILVMEVCIGGTSVFMGTLVDAVAEVLEISDDEIRNSPGMNANMRNEFISGFYYHGEKYLMILDMDKVYAADEVLSLQDIPKVIPVSG
jgi:purine-binding chemotaxis protein CheW